MLMPNFFKEFPKDKMMKGTFKVRTYQLFMFRKDEIVKEIEITGPLWKAYLKARWNALLVDIKTGGSESGVAWGIEKVEEDGEYNVAGFTL